MTATRATSPVSTGEVRILVVKEKHGDRHFLVATPEQQVAAAWLVLKDHWDNGWFYDPREVGEYSRERYEKDQELLGMTEVQLGSLPESVRQSVADEVRAAQARQEQRDADTEEYLELKRIIEDQDLSFELVELRNGRTRIKAPAWDAFQRRGDYEYEGYELITVTDPLSQFVDEEEE